MEQAAFVREWPKAMHKKPFAEGVRFNNSLGVIPGSRVVLRRSVLSFDLLRDERGAFLKFRLLELETLLASDSAQIAKKRVRVGTLGFQ